MSRHPVRSRERAVDVAHDSSQIDFREDRGNGHFSHLHGDKDDHGDTLRGLEPGRHDDVVVLSIVLLWLSLATTTPTNAATGFDRGGDRGLALKETVFQIDGGLVVALGAHHEGESGSGGLTRCGWMWSGVVLAVWLLSKRGEVNHAYWQMPSGRPLSNSLQHSHSHLINTFELE